ncbi:ligand-dependent nuclear receptor-interacting factor 1 isoform X1 [Centrocercus urophasianus]|uniref:ligand-dependent nuclear receptor-interacting factor 1 isoform X1 n=2 Tax=Centrocercus urophasianus TaxID=9002 RepID=UPI001C64D17C|nr:ligand-dependent nuclear receptor-interacting factor 1 isoform X1 [Centrocercus urophasianus]
MYLSRERMSSIAGCMYRVVQTTGPDGKNLLKLLPISKPSGNFVPVVQSSAMSNNPNVNVSSPVHLAFKTQLASTAASSSVKIPVFQSPNSGKIILPRTLDKQGGVRAGSDKESVTTESAADIQSSCVSVDRQSLQNAAVTSSSEQSHTAHMLGNTKDNPISVKPPVLPSGHHLQIPADAEVKSVPASFLPASIQQKILAAAATNVSDGADSKKMPMVIYVSPVNAVKTVLPKRLQADNPKPAPDVSKTLQMAAPQKAHSSSPETGTSDAQQCQHAPMKWIVRESPQLPAPCLIPVKSSNNVASKILKTLSDMKNVEVNSANILSRFSIGSGVSKTKITSIKDNALVMCNGKVYLLTRRGSDVLSAQADMQASSSCGASLKKGTSKLIDSTEVTKISNKVVNLVLSKNKGVPLPQKDPKVCTNSKASSPGSLRNDLKSASAALVIPSVEEQSSTVNQGKSLPFMESISSGTTPITALGMQENTCQDGKEVIHSPKAASAVLPQSEHECAFSEDWQKVQRKKMYSLGKVNQNKDQEKPHWKQYLQLRTKFGLYKEERVYLKRIPLTTSCEKPDERVSSSNSLEKKNDSCTSSSLDVTITDRHRECIKEEKVILDLEEGLSKKRKTKFSLPDSGKRRRASVKSATSSSSEYSGGSSITLNRSVSPPPALLQRSISTDFVSSTDAEREPCSQNSDDTDSDIPVLVSCEDHASLFEGSFRDDAFPLTPPDLDETIRDEKIKRLKQLLREREAALEEMRKKNAANLKY